MEVVILTLFSLLSVLKGTYNIPMVFNVTIRGLNNLLWDTNFMFPLMGSLLMIFVTNIHMVNLDVGEIFYIIRL